MRQGAQVGRIAAIVAAVVVVGLGAGCSDSASGGSTASAGKQAANGNVAAAPSGGAPAAPGDVAGAPDHGAAPPSAQNSLAKAPVAGRSIVYTATLTVRTKDVAGATANAETLAAANGGFVGGENSQSGTVPDVEGVTQSTVTLRVPSTAFDKVIGQLGAGGVLQSENRTASDVTSQVVDTGTRISAQQASIARITDLMKSAGSLADVVTLENELSRREADLESMQAQLAALNDQVSLSTITVTFLVPEAAPPPSPAPPKHRNALQLGLHDGWIAFVGTVKVLLVIFGVLLPLVVTAAVLWWPVSRLVRRGRAIQQRVQERTQARQAAPAPSWQSGGAAAAAATPAAAPATKTAVTPAAAPDKDAVD